MRHSLTNLQPQARAWLLGQIAEGKTDSRLAQRFHLWLRQQSGGEVTYHDSFGLFGSACHAERIKATVVDGRWAYGIYPDGIAPQPESDYVAPSKEEQKS